MIKFALSNIALSPYNHDNELERLAQLGFTGLEIAPSRIWKDTWRGLRAKNVKGYRDRIEAAGLSAIGLHSLLYDHPDLTIFGDRTERRTCLEFLIHLSGVCRDLGGRT